MNHPYHYSVEKNILQKLLDWGLPFLLFLLFFAFYNFGKFTPQEMVKTSGLLAISLLAITLLVGPICRIFPALDVLKAHRKFWGISSFVAALIHVGLVFIYYYKFNLAKFIDFASPKYAGTVSGLLALIILFLVTLTSNQKALNALSPKAWKAIQLTSYLALILAVAHFYLMEQVKGILVIKRLLGQITFAVSALVILFRMAILVLPSKKVGGQKGIIHLQLLVGLLALTVAAIVIVFSPNKNQTNLPNSSVLSEKSGSDESHSGSSQNETSKSDNSTFTQESPKSESGNNSSNDRKTSSFQIRLKTESSNKQKSEIRFSEGERIKIATEEGRAKIEARINGTRIKYEIKDGKVEVKVKNEQGEELEAENEDIDELEQELEDEGIEIATAGGKISLKRNQVAASVNFPLSVNPQTGELTVTTPGGSKVVTILPDQAVQNMLAGHVISSLQTATGSAQSSIKLEVEGSLPVYTILGLKNFRILGLIPVETPVTAVVSAENGQLVSTQQSLLTQIIDLLSP